MNRLCPNWWTAAVWATALLFSIPICIVLFNIFLPAGEIWEHLASTVLPRYLRNSLWLMLGVSIGTLGIGVSAAWLVSMCHFPGRRYFEWALLLPMAAPAYVLAYTYTDLLDVSGPVQTALREATGWGPRDYWFPPIRSLGGAIAMLTLVLYPYVYLPTRVAFLERSKSVIEASLSLGCTPWQAFRKVALPLARPAIVAGLTLVLMETLNDFGTVQFFGVDTFTTGIFRTWFGFGERVASAQLAAMLLMAIFGLLLLERWSRGRVRYYQTPSTTSQPPRYHLSGQQLIAAWLACGWPIVLGFVIPAIALTRMSIKAAGYGLDRDFWQYAGNTVIVAAIAASLAVVLALVLAYGLRLHGNPAMRLATRLAAMGYAVPGAVIAVGVLIPVGWLDNTIDGWMDAVFGIRTGLLLSGTIAALVFAYLVRFLAVSFNTVEASLVRIKPTLDDAARSLGHSPLSTLTKVHAPLMASGLMTAIMMVFVDTVKELPATLILRPFNFETLATRVYRLASDERLAQSAPGALAIVAVGMIPVLVLILSVQRSRERSQQDRSSVKS